jgi:primosomal replication protein N
VSSNRVDLQVLLVQRDSLRYSPAGIPILGATLAHSSEQPEAGSTRKVEFERPAIFAGGAAQAADRLELGCRLRVNGFLASKRKQSKLLSLHVTEFELIEV